MEAQRKSFTSAAGRALETVSPTFTLKKLSGGAGGVLTVSGGAECSFEEEGAQERSGVDADGIWLH